MFAVKHSLFVGPGTLPKEIWEALRKRPASVQVHGDAAAPRLLAVFETAAAAEALASQIQRLNVGVAVAGPEQPPAESAWTEVLGVEFEEGGWHFALANHQAHVSANDIAALTVLEWKSDEENARADLAVLLTLRDAGQLLLRASRLEKPSPHTLPHDGVRRISDFLDTAARVLPPHIRIRSRRLAEGDFRGEHQALTGDLFALVLAVIDQVDTAAGELPHPLTGKSPVSTRERVVQSHLAGWSAWVLYLTSLGAMAVSLAYFTLAVLGVRVLAALIGLALGAWGTRRFMWSRWLAQANWGAATPIPSWPIAAEEPGIAPRGLELALDAAALVLVCLGALDEGLLRALSLSVVPFLLLAVLTSASAVYEAWRRG